MLKGLLGSGRTQHLPEARGLTSGSEVKRGTSGTSLQVYKPSYNQESEHLNTRIPSHTLCPDFAPKAIEPPSQLYGWRLFHQSRSIWKEKQWQQLSKKVSLHLTLYSEMWEIQALHVPPPYFLFKGLKKQALWDQQGLSIFFVSLELLQASSSKRNFCLGF